jgi:hypothetical protein
MLLERRALAATFAVALFVAACGGAAASPTPAATAAPAGGAASPAAATQEPASQAPAATDAGSVPVVPNLPGSSSELEGMLPSTVNGLAFTKTSFGGGLLPATIPVDSGVLGTFLKDSGKTMADMSFAMATPADATKAGTYLMAFQVKGADGTKLAETLAGTSSSDLTKATVGGKQVLQTGATGMGLTLYVKGDVVFYVIAIGDPTLTEGILAALP